MAKGISVYPTANTGAEKPMDVTGTVSGEKRLLDVAIVEGSIEGELVPSGLRNGGKITLTTINDSSWTPILVAAEALTNQINVQNFTGSEVKVNHDFYGPLPAGYEGMRIPSNTERFYQVNGAFRMPYVKAEPGAGTVVIEVEEIG